MAATENSFDVVSKVDLQEVRNAIEQATKEVNARFDLKDSKSEIKLEGSDVIQLASADEYKLKAVIEILSHKMVKRNVPLKSLVYEKLEQASGNSVRQKVKLQQGIPGDKAKDIVKLVKDSKKKAQASIQADTVRISSKDRDTLQEVIALLKGHEFGIDLQFTNYRSNLRSLATIPVPFPKVVLDPTPAKSQPRLSSSHYRIGRGCAKRNFGTYKPSRQTLYTYDDWRTGEHTGHSDGERSVRPAA